MLPNLSQINPLNTHTPFIFKVQPPTYINAMQ
jgi:hypothetical protein